MKSVKICFIFLILVALLFPLTSMATTLSNTATINHSVIVENMMNTDNKKPNNNTDANTSTTNIISISSENVTPSTEFYLKLNLLNIAYNKFKVEIRNTANLTANTVTSEISDLESSAYITSFIVDKSLITLDKLGIVYTSPSQETNISFTVTITNLEDTSDSLKAELNTLKTTLKTNFDNLKNTLTNLTDLLLKAEITSEDENYQAITASITKVTESLNNSDTDYNSLQNSLTNLNITLLETNIVFPDESDQETYKTTLNSVSESITSFKNTISKINELVEKINHFTSETLEEKITIQVRKVVDSNNSNNESEKENITEDEKNKQNEDKPFGEKDSLVEEMYKDKNKEMTSNMKKMMEEMSQLQFNLDEANSTISSLTKTVTYQGSQNNYLKSLSISNIEFKNNFKKTTLDYFATVDKETTKVTVNAVAEDNSAIVTIYGNTNLQSGKNKILITVTADDGSIKTYRIYVTKQN